MTVLNDKQIAALCMGASEEMMLKPFVFKKERMGALSYGLGHFGYDIRISGKCYKPGLEYGSYIDPTDNVKNVSPIEYDLSNKDEPVILHPNQFILAGTLEYFKMPPDVVGLVKDKSTLARLGIAVQNTVLEPGWHGYLTVEISNHGYIPIRLTEGMPIAQVLFWKGERPDQQYDGRYSGQDRATGAIDHD